MTVMLHGHRNYIYIIIVIGHFKSNQIFMNPIRHRFTKAEAQLLNHAFVYTIYFKLAHIIYSDCNIFI